MAIKLGTFTALDDENSIADPQIMAAAVAIKAPRYQGAVWNMMGAPEAALGLKTVEFKINNRTLTAKGGTLDGGINDAVTDITLDATSVKLLTVGHTLQIEDEVVGVKSINRTTSTITVFKRGGGESTAAAHVDTTAYTVIGYAASDLDLKNVESISEETSVYSNYTQTIFETIDWTFAGANYARQGISPDRIEVLLQQEALERVYKNLANSAVNGQKQVGTTAGTPFMSAGLYAQLANNASGGRTVLSYNANGALTEAKLKAALDEVILSGSPNKIICSQAQKNVINTFNMANSSLQVNTGVENHTAGTYIDYIDYEGMMIKVEVDSDNPSSKLAIITEGKIKKQWVENDGLKIVDEPGASSREKRQSIQGTFAFTVEGVGQDHTYIYGITA